MRSRAWSERGVHLPLLSLISSIAKVTRTQLIGGITGPSAPRLYIARNGRKLQRSPTATRTPMIPPQLPSAPPAPGAYLPDSSRYGDGISTDPSLIVC
jgi:hypothetical protein